MNAAVDRAMWWRIRRRLKRGATIKQIADEFAISERRARAIRRYWLTRHEAQALIAKDLDPQQVAWAVGWDLRSVERLAERRAG